MSRSPAISFSPFQKASSRLTLVLCPAMTIERLTTGDFIDRLPLSGVVRVPDRPSSCARIRVPAPPCRGHGGRGSRPRAAHRAHARVAYAPHEICRCCPSPALDGTRCDSPASVELFASTLNAPLAWQPIKVTAAAGIEMGAHRYGDGV